MASLALLLLMAAGPATCQQMLWDSMNELKIYMDPPAPSGHGINTRTLEGYACAFLDGDCSDHDAIRVAQRRIEARQKRHEVIKRMRVAMETCKP